MSRTLPKKSAGNPHKKQQYNYYSNQQRRTPIANHPIGTHFQKQPYLSYCP